jgi:hypothetical protein
MRGARPIMRRQRRNRNRKRPSVNCRRNRHPRATASPLSLEVRANGSRECAPDDRLREPRRMGHGPSSSFEARKPAAPLRRRAHLPERTQLRSSGDDARHEWPKNKQDRATRAEHALLTDN